MKKSLYLFIAFLCFVTAVPAALAADSQTYDLADLNMTVSAPAGWITFTRDIQADDPNLKTLGTDSKTLSDFLNKNNIYLYSGSLGSHAEIGVTMIANDGSRDVYDFNRISDADIPADEKSVTDEIQKNMAGKITYSDSSIYKNEQVKYVVLNWTQQYNGMTVYGKQYLTVINGQAINITLHSYAGEVTDELAQTLKTMVDSVTFTKVTQKPTNMLNLGFIGIAGAIIGGAVVSTIIRSRLKKKAAAADPKPSEVMNEDTKDNDIKPE